MNTNQSPASLATLAWPASRLGEALEWLARRTGLALASPEAFTDGPADNMPAVEEWLQAAARQIGIECKPVECSYGDVERLVQRCAPALLSLGTAKPMQLLAVVRRGRRRIEVLAPDLSVRKLPAAAVAAAVRSECESPLLQEATRLLDGAGVPPRWRDRALSALFNAQLAGVPAARCILLQLPPQSSWGHQARAAGLPGRVLALLGSHAVEASLWALSWWLIGQAALKGRFEAGWMWAWALLLVAMIPFRALITWWQGTVAIGVGALLKRRLLAGALQLKPEEVRRQGAGELLGRVIESEAVEALAMSGGFLVLITVVELALALAVLASGANGVWLSGLLLCWVVVGVLAGIQYGRRRDWWTQARLAVTNGLVERMTGHRTRLAQQPPEHWHAGEDQSLAGLAALASRMDSAARRLTALIPRGWLVTALITLAPAFVATSDSPTALVLSVGGMLLGFRALQRFVLGMAQFGGAAIAWKQVAPISDAATRAQSIPPVPLLGPGTHAASEPAKKAPVLEAHDISFRHALRAEPVLRECHLKIFPGDRILLEGASGSGKSTLAAILAGLRMPDSGLLLAGGLDRHSLSLDAWRRRVATAPQFHENHVLTGTFAFNLLLGSLWPPRQEDLDRAVAVCEELGLGPLLARMPAGPGQVVGDGGWQLSHGERSRLYIARALLQGAELVLFDESFAALDPENLRDALHCVMRRAPALLVIAHP